MELKRFSRVSLTAVVVLSDEVESRLAQTDADQGEVDAIILLTDTSQTPSRLMASTTD